MSEEAETDGRLHPNWGTVAAIGIALITQTGAAIWWASGIDRQMATVHSNISEIKNWQDKQDVRIERLDDKVNDQKVISSSVEAKIEGIESNLSRIEDLTSQNVALLRQLIEKVASR